MPKKTYDCLKCPGYCCSYPLIPTVVGDIQRLADHFGIPYETAKHRFTKPEGKNRRILRRKDDEHFGRICRFFDSEKRRCGVYKARPKICREFPGESRCGYYDFLTFERDHQRDDKFIATTENRF